MKNRKRTDTYPITATLKSNGVAVNLTGYAVTINVVDKATGTSKVTNASATITDAVNGRVSYTPIAGDVDTVSSYNVEWKAVSPGGTPYHFPSKDYDPLDIQQNLG
jgi:BppU N-terminal domain